MQISCLSLPRNLILYRLGARTSLTPNENSLLCYISSLIHLEISLFGYLGDFHKKTNDYRL
jgi:hypothetical protein